ncbi:arginine--tRNA ligase [Patescibacteria group bacterium]|nr:arginine--tRNA ligase [Patescibacteria group bacterium]
MINLKQALIEDIAAGVAAAQKAGDLPKQKKLPAVVVERPENDEHGDYASPVALSLAKGMKKEPLEIVEAIITQMPKNQYVGKLEGVAPGFLNVRLNPGWLTARLDDVVEADLCGGVVVGEGQKVNLEFISANPTGPLTLGNIRTAFTVDTLGNVMECAGYAVTREYYVNDAGEQIVKLGQSVLRRILQAQGKKIAYPEELYQGEYIKEVAATVAETFVENKGKEFTKEDLKEAATVAEVSKAAMQLLLSEIKTSIKADLKIEFDVFTSERKLRESGAVDDIIKKLKRKKAIYTKEGASFLKTTKYGDDEDRVVVKSNGEYSYFAPDIAYHQDKFKQQYDEIFTFLGADHAGHVPRMRAAMEWLGNDNAKLHFETAQFLRLVRDGKTVKLSKRAGEIVTPHQLIAEVGYDAARYFMVQHALSTHMDFDLDLAKERSERNPVYYIQYAYVRLQAILRKAKQEGAITKVGETVELSSRAELTHTTELALMKQLYRFSEVVAEVATTYQVHDLAYYAHDLARSVHVFYKNVPVLGADSERLVQHRLQLVLAARAVLDKVLGLLGISKPDVM